MEQIQISTSLILVRFLSVQLRSSLSSLETCVMYTLIILLSHLMGPIHILCTLSIRLGVLLLLEEFRPLVSLGDDHLMRLMVGAGMLSIVAVVPPTIRASQEGKLIVSSVMYMYSDVLSFALGWRDAHVTVLIAGALASQWIGLQLERGDCSPIYRVVLDIGSMSIASVVIDIFAGFESPQSDTSILFFLLLMTLLHFVPVRLASGTESYLLIRVASILQQSITSDAWLWCVFLCLLSRALQVWPGPEAFPTQISLVLFINVAISATLAYIQHLSMFDTLVTLKASALILQFIVHELASVTVQK
jgi:hypothetical protein